MKNDLKNIFSATAIYAGLLFGLLIWAIPLFLVIDKYPVVRDVINIFGAVYYLVLFSYIFVRWLKKKKNSSTMSR
jgi:threonine/homoserine/homoserine lactone efflux protein